MTYPAPPVILMQVYNYGKMGWGGGGGGALLRRRSGSPMQEVSHGPPIVYDIEATAEQAHPRQNYHPNAATHHRRRRRREGRDENPVPKDGQ